MGMSATDSAMEVLLDPSLEPIIEMVLLRDGDGYEAHADDGWVRFDADGARLDGSGRDPLGDEATDRFAPLSSELASRFPHRTSNSYPFARQQVVQLFDHPSAPDICVIHSAAHNWEEAGGHIGEHGSLDVVQSRAPFIIGGCGVRALGTVERACRL